MSTSPADLPRGIRPRRRFDPSVASSADGPDYTSEMRAAVESDPALSPGTTDQPPPPLTLRPSPQQPVEIAGLTDDGSMVSVSPAPEPTVTVGRPPLNLTQQAVTTTAQPFVADDGSDPRPMLRSEALEGERAALQRTKDKDTNGRWKSALLNVLHSVGEQAQLNAEGAARTGRPIDMYSIASLGGSAIGGGVAGAVKPNLDEHRARQTRIDKLGEQIAQALQVEQHASGIRAREAQTRQTDANTNWLNARPGIEQEKIDAKGMKDEQAAVLRNLGMLKGQKIDPTNPNHAAFLARAQRAKVFIDPEAWNNARGNLATVTLTDPDDPTKTQTINYNKLTGEQQIVGQKGFQQPVNSETGMTANQEHVDADRDASRLDLEGQRKIQNEFSRQHINLQREGLDLQKLSRDDRLTADTRKELGAAEKLRAESERWQSVANDADKRTRYFDADSGEWRESKKWSEKRDEASARAESLRGQLYGSYGYLWNGKMSRADFLRNHPALSEVVRRSGDKENPIPTGEIDNYAKKYGITLTDADSTQGPGAVNAPAMPHRGAPAQTRPAPQAGARFTEQDVRARAQAAGKDPDAAVAAARARHLIP